MTRTEAGSGLRSADSARLVVGLGPIPAEVVKPALGPGFEFIGSPDANDLQNAEAAIVRAAENIGAQELAGCRT